MYSLSRFHPAQADKLTYSSSNTLNPQKMVAIHYRSLLPGTRVDDPEVVSSRYSPTNSTKVNSRYPASLRADIILGTLADDIERTTLSMYSSTNKKSPL